VSRPKIKSHKGVSKRLRVSGTGKLLRRKAGMRHILTSKDRARKRRLKRVSEVDATMAQNIRHLLPYK
jgi:large subunit ribosomal protein L35